MIIVVQNTLVRGPMRRLNLKNPADQIQCIDQMVSSEMKRIRQKLKTLSRKEVIYAKIRESAKFEVSSWKTNMQIRLSEESR